MLKNSFWFCKCYYTHNIYVKELDKHFTFTCREQFLKDYKEILDQMNYDPAAVESLIIGITSEIDRRKKLEANTVARRKIIKENYIPLDRSVYKLQEEFLEPQFIMLVEAAKKLDYEEVYKGITELSAEKKIFGFPVFNSNFCKAFLKEVSHFEESDFQKERPNTMNKYGILIDDIGFHDNFSVILRDQYLDPLAKVLFPEWRGQHLDSHKIFTVRYKYGQDTDLGYHYDNSEVTLNVCFGKNFTGGDLYFGEMNTTPVSQSTCTLVPHNIGYGILHRGQQYHGALPIAHGERQNLIMWMRSSSVRNSQCPMCFYKPSLAPAENYGDGFTKPEEMYSCNMA